MKTIKLCIAILLLLSFAVKAQEVINLYSGAVPNSKDSNIKEFWNEKAGFYKNVINPTLQIYLPDKEKSSGAAACRSAGRPRPHAGQAPRAAVRRRPPRKSRVGRR